MLVIYLCIKSHLSLQFYSTLHFLRDAAQLHSIIAPRRGNQRGYGGATPIKGPQGPILPTKMPRSGGLGARKPPGLPCIPGHNYYFTYEITFICPHSRAILLLFPQIYAYHGHFSANLLEYAQFCAFLCRFALISANECFHKQICLILCIFAQISTDLHT